MCNSCSLHNCIKTYNNKKNWRNCPLKWAIITPVFKVGPRNLPKNYRTVALASHLMKILAKNIHQFLETHQKISPKQRGFCSGRSCLSQLLEHHNKILEELKKSNNTIHFIETRLQNTIGTAIKKTDGLVGVI